ncbi:MAG: hypothetical protein KFF72_12185, partial [Arthrospira sp. SH-MAG29]
FAVADNIVPDHPRIRDRSVCLLVAIHPLPASEEGEFRNILLKILPTQTITSSCVATSPFPASFSHHGS